MKWVYILKMKGGEFMRKELLNEIIQLKEEERILQAVCGNPEIKKHIFSKQENEMMKALWQDNRAMELLVEVERKLRTDEEVFKQEQH